MSPSSSHRHRRLLTSPPVFLLYLLAILSLFPACSVAADEDECEAANRGSCHNEPEALRLKIIAIFAILVTSMIGVGLPLFSRSLPALRPESNLFVIVKAFASGVILATGYMHVLPDSFENLTSPCLPENPWRKFPFTAFIAMLSAVFTLMLDSFMMSFYSKRREGRKGSHGLPKVDQTGANEDGLPKVSDGHGHNTHFSAPHQTSDDSAVLLSRYRIIAQVLEMGIIVHSVVIGLSMGASQNPCSIRPLVAALCFHQMFEGMGLGGCILQAEYGMKMKATLAFFFSVTTPFGIALGIGLTKVYSDNSPTALIVVGVLNASSAGLLNYMALVDLLAVDFMGQKLQGSMKLQGWAYVAVLLGAGGMSLMAKWA